MGGGGHVSEAQVMGCPHFLCPGVGGRGVKGAMAHTRPFIHSSTACSAPVISVGYSDSKTRVFGIMGLTFW